MCVTYGQPDGYKEHTKIKNKEVALGIEYCERRGILCSPDLRKFRLSR